MQNSFSESYKEAGVDVTSGYRAVELIKKHVERTKIPGVIEGIGGFGGLFALPKTGSGEPVLVSGTDGVGTKLKIAMLMDKHGTVGIDCVAMCVNDIICAGARPLFFLDYIAIGKNIPEKVEQIVAGVAEGCVQAGCALVGGETAEHPGVMGEDEYDLAGFSVGIAEKSKIPDKKKVRHGDAVIALASSGVHSNGFSLTRKVFNIDNDGDILDRHYGELSGTLGEELLIPTKIYVKPVLSLFEKMPDSVRSVCHITGGGFYENIPRAFNGNVGAVIQKSSFEIPAVFSLIACAGKIPQRDMFNTYNMGVGMCVIVSAEKADEAACILNSCGEKAAIIGEIRDGIDGVIIE
ncbi:MAG: phosphoribosylformylglycinamidine cyclo-ligase [Treponema sp.]|jgi:phosphoribosylformylglycinamidine cyclo-ligase|nr:phosphoribosylformylglycinamidine cyclo-ligase [Treponema sp.]